MNKTSAAVGLLGCAALLAACGGSVTTAETTATTSPDSAATSPTSESTAGATTTAITPGTTASCQPVTETEIAGLFTRWNDDVKGGDPKRVVENYAADSILVPTVSNQVRQTAAEKQDYFDHFLADRPSGTKLIAADDKKLKNGDIVNIDLTLVLDRGRLTLSPLPVRRPRRATASSTAGRATTGRSSATTARGCRNRARRPEP